MADNRTTQRHRTCPSCGQTTEARFCPNDGTATIEGNALFADPTNLRPGDVINGRYRIVGLIGRGGFGAVYSGEHTGTHQQVALKLLMPSEDDPRTDIRRFHQEAQLTASLRHPNTVRVFDVGQTQHGALFLAMELLHGETLEDRLAKLEQHGKALSQDETLDMAVQVLKSLGEAHGKGLVHRDLKPANIMITELEGERLFKVLDFGIARRHGSTLTGQGRALGTPAYMSPEQCMGDDVDGRADLYALGCVMFRCLVGRTPYEADTVFAMMQGHALAPVPDVQRLARTPVSVEMSQAIVRVLGKRPPDRFPSARDLRDVLERARRDAPDDDEAPTMAWTLPAASANTGASPRVAPSAPKPAPPRVAQTEVSPMRRLSAEDAAPPPPQSRSLGNVPVLRVDPAAESAQTADNDALPHPTGTPRWLPWAIGAVVLAGALGSYVAWK